MPNSSDKLAVRERILEHAAFDLGSLVHPASRITIEAAAKRAGQSASTVASQAGSTENFRRLLFQRLATRVPTEPGPHTWSALHDSSLASLSASEAFTEVLVARMEELAQAETFNLVLGLYSNRHLQHLDQLRDHLDHFNQALGAEMSPLLVAAAAAKGTDIRTELATPSQHERVGLILRAGALNSWLCVRSDEADTTAAAAASRLLAKVAWEPSSVATSWRPEPYPPEEPPVPLVLDSVVEAGVELILAHEYRITSPLSVAGVCQATGIGVSAFYRAFESVAELNHAALAKAIDAAFEMMGSRYFSEHNAQNSLVLSNNPDRYPILVNTYMESIRTTNKDLDVAVWAWCSYPSTAPLIARSLFKNRQDRTEYYQRIIEGGFGDQFRPGLEARVLSAVHTTVSTVFELHQRLFEGDRLRALVDIEAEVLLTTLDLSILMK